MRILFYYIPLIFIVLLTACGRSADTPYAGITVKDDLGYEITLQKTPTRIISLAPNLTEMIFDLGLGKSVVGNTTFCNYPHEAGKVEKVGDMLTYNYERILRLKPDLIFILVEGNTKETYDKFKSLGLKLFVANPRNYNGIKKTYSDIGKIFGIERKAAEDIAGWDSTVAKIRMATNNLNRSAMFLVELRSLILAGKKSFIHEYMEFCGLKNIAAGTPVNYPVFNREEILLRDPDYIIYPDDGGTTTKDLIRVYPEWEGLKAVKNNHVFFVNRDVYSRPGSRFVEALEDLFIHLQGDLKPDRSPLQ